MASIRHRRPYWDSVFLDGTIIRSNKRLDEEESDAFTKMIDLYVSKLILRTDEQKIEPTVWRHCGIDIGK